MPNVWHPLYWWRAATGREFERTPVTVQLNGARAPGELVRHTIDYSFARPDLEHEAQRTGRWPVNCRLSPDGKKQGDPDVKMWV